MTSMPPLMPMPPTSCTTSLDPATLEAMTEIAERRRGMRGLILSYSEGGGMAPRDEITVQGGEVVWERIGSLGGARGRGVERAPARDEQVVPILAAVLAGRLWEVPGMSGPLAMDAGTVTLIAAIQGLAGTISFTIRSSEEQQYPALVQVIAMMRALVRQPMLRPDLAPPPNPGPPVGPPVRPLPEPLPVAPVASPRRSSALPAKPGRLLDACVAFLRADGWPATVDESASMAVTRYAGHNGAYSCLFQTREAEQQIIFYCAAPRTVPARRRTAMVELLTRENHGLVIGSFELGLEDGELRLKNSIDVEGIAVPDALLRKLAQRAVQTMDEAYPRIEAVLGPVESKLAAQAAGGGQERSGAGVEPSRVAAASSCPRCRGDADATTRWCLGCGASLIPSRGIPGDPLRFLLPILQAPGWPGAEHSLHHVMCAGLGIAGAPIMSLGYLGGGMTAYAGEKTLELRGMSYEELLQEAATNLCSLPASWRVIPPRDDAPRPGGILMLTCDDDRLASERIADRGFLLHGQRMLGAQMIAVAAPLRGMICATRLGDAATLIELAEETCRRNPGAALSPWVFAVEQGGIVGKLFLDHGRVCVRRR